MIPHAFNNEKFYTILLHLGVGLQKRNVYETMYFTTLLVDFLNI